ncbi:hypothetical protein FKW77_009865 [Venturia effusa]|uniref:Uncharacterized protein n=1 Tax=Venturia effusa TaxID=50376 RepID=A0A517LA03_9PEZI|nr:hypothetical protein FKW77_009865 [Venturia effusa]
MSRHKNRNKPTGYTRTKGSKYATKCYQSTNHALTHRQLPTISTSGQINENGPITAARTETLRRSNGSHHPRPVASARVTSTVLTAHTPHTDPAPFTLAARQSGLTSPPPPSPQHRPLNTADIIRDLKDIIFLMDVDGQDLQRARRQIQRGPQTPDDMQFILTLTSRYCADMTRNYGGLQLVLRRLLDRLDQAHAGNQEVNSQYSAKN